ncbi:MAG TPA: GAF domain-containing protein, partial [Candidatus Dormibacteraeota bacterium]
MEEPQARLRAMAEVLQIMTSTSFELQSVLEAVVERAKRLCRAQSGFIYRLDGDRFRMDVALNVSDEFRAFTESHPITVGNRGTLTARVGMERRTIQIPDVLADPDYNYWEAQRLGQFRTILGVPLLRGDVLLGVLTLWRTHVEPFTDGDIELVTLFADQATIAIDQARRAHELADALEQQTAASEVLRIIGQSTTDLEAVFLPLITRAVQLCDADHGDIIRFDPQTHQYLQAAHYGVGSDAYRAIVRGRPYRPGRDTLVGRTILEAGPVQIDDALADADYKFVEAQQSAGFRSILGVPLMREGFPIGVISAWRRQVRPFSEREIRILTTFADQAVVAVENVRLVRALQRQTEELSRYVTPQVASMLATDEGEQLLA